MRHSVLPALLCCFALSGCGPTTVNSLVKEQGAKQMPAREVLELVKGNTLALHAFSEDAQLYFEPSGKIFAQGVSTDKDKGRWDVSEGGELCFRMDKWWYGDLRCFTVYQSGNKGEVQLAGGSGVLQYSAKQAAGDDRGLYSDSDQKKKSQRRSLLKEDAAKETAQKPRLTEERPASEAASKDNAATVEFMAKDCPGCTLAGVDLGRAELVEAKLAGADLHGSNLSMANLRRADLQKANLHNAILTYANLPGADLRGADLRGANLKGANLIKADLTGAKLEGADLTEALREGTKGIK